MKEVFGSHGLVVQKEGALHPWMSQRLPLLSFYSLSEEVAPFSASSF